MATTHTTARTPSGIDKGQLAGDQEAHRRQAQTRVYTRAAVALALLATWAVTGLSGIILALAPSGRRSGQLVLLFLTRAQWNDLHTWIGIAAIILTMAHIIIDWRTLKSCVRSLVSPRHGATPCA